MANQFPGDFALKEVKLYNIDQTEDYDIKALVQEINLYESVFSSSLHFICNKKLLSKTFIFIGVMVELCLRSHRLM